MSWQHNRKLTTRQIFTLLMAAAVFCLLIPHSTTSRLDEKVGRSISSPTKFLRNYALPIRQTLRQQGLTSLTLKDIENLKKQNEGLIAQNNNLREDINVKIDTINNLTHLRQSQGMDRLNYVIANVTGTDSSKERQSLKLDQGTNSSIQPGQLVIAPTTPPASDNDNTVNEIYSMAVVGRISNENLGAKTSSIQLLNDPGFYMPIVIIPALNRTDSEFRAEGFLKGCGLKETTALFDIKRVPSTCPVKSGDPVLVHTPKLLPIDMIAGFVDKITYDEKTAIEWKIKNIQPALNLYDLQKVYVIIESQPTDNPTN